MILSSEAGCLNSEQLAAHARLESRREESVAIDRHLAGCRACLDRFFELGRQSLTPEIPNIHVVKEVGRGRFGVVYKAWATDGNPRVVALKVLSGASEMERSRFEREIAVLKSLDSAGIVRCLESGTVGDSVYFVMDYVEGVHLDEYFQRTGTGLTEKLLVFQRVCVAVAEAHDEGVVHRDLKPKNILVDDQGQPHILDFGICSVHTPDWSSWARDHITLPGDVIGTLRYMSPEQAWGGAAGPVDERSDVWSLGVMLYEIVTDGQYPYSLAPTPDKPAHEALLERIRKELPRRPRLDAIPRGRDLEVLLERCLTWETKCRLESTRRLADDLERWCAHRRIKTRPLGLPYRLRRAAVGAATRMRWGLALAGVALLAAFLWAAVIRFNVGWYEIGPEVHRPPRLAVAAGAGSGVRDAILIAAVNDNTTDAVLGYASAAGLTDVTDDIRTWRAVHGALMTRLAPARPAGVVWDYYFESEQPGDEAFADGLQTLKRAGVPVVLAALRYDSSGQPDISPNITGAIGRRLRHGVIYAREQVERPGEFVTAIRLAGAQGSSLQSPIVPSLAIATLAAVLHPEARLELDWSGHDMGIGMLYEIEPGAFLRARDRIQFTKVLPGDKRESFVTPGELLGYNTFPLDQPDAWRRRTVAYEMLLTASSDRLEELTRGRLVVFGDTRNVSPGAPRDRHPVRFGRDVVGDVPGCTLLADAIAGLLAQRHMRSPFPMSGKTFLLALVICFVGWLLPMRIARSSMLAGVHARRLLWSALAALTLAGFGLMITSERFMGVHAGMGAFALCAAMMGSFWVEFARNRHRVAERKRHAVEGIGITTTGTITLLPRRPISNPKARSR